MTKPKAKATHKKSLAADAPRPVILVLFGITGDLASRKLLPALYHLFKDDRLPAGSVILGITRRDITADQLLGQVELCVNEVDKVCDPEGLRKVREALRMHTMSQTEGSEYDVLLDLINGIEDERGVCMNRLYYLSIPPQMFEPIVKNLGLHGHNTSCQHGNAATRLLVEKPFGYDTASAQALIEETGEWFSEEQLYRIDHYIAKQSVQDLLYSRLRSPELDKKWNHTFVKRIDVTAFEDLTIEGRASFYDGVGALRDFVQNHLLQALIYATMEVPSDESSESLHKSKQQLLDAIKPIQPDEVTVRTYRAQYEGYREEVQNPHSNTETYAEIVLHIDNSRWQGVPILLRTGKALARRYTAVVLHEMGPDGKGPFELREFPLNGGGDSGSMAGEGYERVLIDANRGDHSLFVTSSEVLASWRIVENVLTAWAKSGDSLGSYAKGSGRVR